MADAERRFFFLHVMRTGGTTFLWHLKANFGPAKVYPAPEDNPETHESVTNLDYLWDIPEQRWTDLKVVTGHFPYFVIDLLPFEYEKITILREPVARTVSFLQQWQKVPGLWQGKPFEAIYDDPLIVPHYQNHMTKLFGLSADSGAAHYAVDADIDDVFMKRAQENLASIETIGFTEDHEAFVDKIVQRYGWRRPNVPAQHVTEPAQLSDSFIERIRRDNAADIEFYEFARALVAERDRS
ncbi:MAG: hypothetical protein ACR2QE_19780 [Acidimicrobiales bacterium]